MDAQFFGHYLNLLRLSTRGTSTRSYHIFDEEIFEIDRDGSPIDYVELPPVAFYLAINSHVSGRQGPVYPVMGQIMRDYKFVGSLIIHIDGDSSAPPVSKEEQHAARQALSALLKPVYFSVTANAVWQPGDSARSCISVTVQERCTLSGGQTFAYERVLKHKSALTTGPALLRHKLYNLPGVFSEYEGISVRLIDDVELPKAHLLSEGDNEERVLAIALDEVHQKILGPLTAMKLRHEKEWSKINAMQQAYLSQKRKDEEQLLLDINN